MSQQTTEPAEDQSRSSDRPPYPEDAESLFALVIGPATWTAHFLLCYVAAAIFCEKTGTLQDLLIPVAVITVLALVLIAWSAYWGWKRHRLGSGTVPHDFDSPEDRHRFLGFATMLLSGLSIVAVLFTAAVFVLAGTCD